MANVLADTSSIAPVLTRPRNWRAAGLPFISIQPTTRTTIIEWKSRRFHPSRPTSSAVRTPRSLDRPQTQRPRRTSMPGSLGLRPGSAADAPEGREGDHPPSSKRLFDRAEGGKLPEVQPRLAAARRARAAVSARVGWAIAMVLHGNDPWCRASVSPGRSVGRVSPLFWPEII